jgi:hypothetical protein
MEDITQARLVEVADNLFNVHTGSEGKILDAKIFKTAMAKALGDAYERGLQDGLSIKIKGPDA